MEILSPDEFKARLKALQKTYSDNEGFCHGIDVAIAGVNASTAGENMYGRWIHEPNFDRCSLCGYETGAYEHGGDCCPGCGAAMRNPTQQSNQG